VIVFESPALALILLIAINILVAARRATTFPKYWQDYASQPGSPEQIAIWLCQLSMASIGVSFEDLVE
jgi:hypothetical protein